MKIQNILKLSVTLIGLYYGFTTIMALLIEVPALMAFSNDYLTYPIIINGLKLVLSIILIAKPELLVSRIPGLDKSSELTISVSPQHFAMLLKLAIIIFALALVVNNGLLILREAITLLGHKIDQGNLDMYYFNRPVSDVLVTSLKLLVGLVLLFNYGMISNRIIRYNRLNQTEQKG